MGKTRFHKQTCQHNECFETTQRTLIIQFNSLRIITQSLYELYETKSITILSLCSIVLWIHYRESVRSTEIIQLRWKQWASDTMINLWTIWSQFRKFKILLWARITFVEGKKRRSAERHQSPFISVVRKQVQLKVNGDRYCHCDERLLFV